MPTDDPSSPRLAELLGLSPAIVAVRAAIDRLAGGDDPVVVIGPSGSGKATVAARLHQRGARAARPFVAVHCAGLWRDRLDAELFGDGATTPAVLRAAGGTLFLDDIDRLPPDAVARLAASVAAGQTAPRRRRVRIVAASRVDDAAFARGRPAGGLLDRADRLALPPLAERSGDIALLIDHFVRAGAYRPPPRFTPAARAYLARQPWPGNVRQLCHVVARAAARYPGRVVDEGAAALLVHGERRTVDRWLATAADPLPMPNRRRPVPIAPTEPGDLAALLAGFEQVLAREMPTITPPPNASR